MIVVLFNSVVFVSFEDGGFIYVMLLIFGLRVSWML